VWLGGLSVLCQIQGEVPGRAILDRWLPGADLPPSTSSFAKPRDGAGSSSPNLGTVLAVRRQT